MGYGTSRTYGSGFYKGIDDTLAITAASSCWKTE